MVVAVKELKAHGHSQQEITQQRKEVIHEATIMLRLGDHCGFPLLLGIQRKVPLFWIVMQFHRINDNSLTYSLLSGIVNLGQGAEKRGGPRQQSL